MKEMLITLLFPRRCPVCGEIVPGISGVRGGALPPLENLICPECIDSLSPVRQPVCMRCGKEVTGSGQNTARIVCGIPAASTGAQRCFIIMKRPAVYGGSKI